MVIALLIGIFILLGGIGLLINVLVPLGVVAGIIVFGLLFLLLPYLIVLAFGASFAGVERYLAGHFNFGYFNLILVLVIVCGLWLVVGVLLRKVNEALGFSKKGSGPPIPPPVEPTRVKGWGTPSLPPPQEKNGAPMKRFKYRWRVGDAEYTGEMDCRDEHVLRAQVGERGGELLEILSVVNKDASLAIM